MTYFTGFYDIVENAFALSLQATDICGHQICTVGVPDS